MAGVVPMPTDEENLVEKARKEAFAAQLRRAMRRSGLSTGALAKAVGVSRSTVGRWLSAEDMPRIVHFSYLQSALKLDISNTLPLAMDAGEQLQGAVVAISASPVMVIPVPIRRDAAANPADPFGSGDDLLPAIGWVPTRLISEREARAMFAVRVVGTCLEPDVRDGWYAIVDPHASKTFGKVAVVSIEGHYHVKRLEQRNGLPVLTSNEGDLRSIESVVFEGMVVGWYKPE